MFEQLNGLLRRLVRAAEGRSSEPTACIIDSQSVKTTNVPAATQGVDVGKRIIGRKRSIVTDTIGLLLAVLVTAASVQDGTAGRQLLTQVAAEHPPPRGLGRHGLQERRHRARRNPGHRRRDRPP